MKERPILFSSPMVRAILAGTKTQTRRIVKPAKIQRADDIAPHESYPGEWTPWIDGEHRSTIECPYGQPGDRLWVKETFTIEHTYDYHGDHSIPGDGRPIQKHDDDPDGGYWLIPHYRATDGEPHIVSDDHEEDDDRTRWRPSIHMPRWASRITLEITGVRVERLQDISEQDAKAEGINRIAHGREGYFYHAERTEPNPHNWVDPIDAYCELWKRINGPGSWERNPFVWVIEFRRVTK